MASTPPAPHSFSLCIANFGVVFFNMLLATRYAVNSSFMLNTKST